MTPPTISEAMPQEIRGEVTAAREAVVPVRIIGGVEVEAVIDTGFDSMLTLPAEIVAELGLPFIMTVPCRLAGGVRQVADLVSAQIEWLGEVRRVDAVVLPDCLIGTELLEGACLTIDYERHTVLIEPAVL